MSFSVLPNPLGSQPDGARTALKSTLQTGRLHAVTARIAANYYRMQKLRCLTKTRYRRGRNDDRVQ